MARDAWAIVVSILDGFVEWTGSRVDAEGGGMLHRRFLPPGVAERVDSGESFLFWMEADGPRDWYPYRLAPPAIQEVAMSVWRGDR